MTNAFKILHSQTQSLRAKAWSNTVLYSSPRERLGEGVNIPNFVKLRAVWQRLGEGSNIFLLTNFVKLCVPYG